MPVPMVNDTGKNPNVVPLLLEPTYMPNAFLKIACQNFELLRPAYIVPEKQTSDKLFASLYGGAGHICNINCPRNLPPV